MSRFFLIIILILSASLGARAQNPPTLQLFKIEKFNNEILITWEIASGNLCEGVKVEHSFDSLNFTSIYDYPGICGSSSASEQYYYSHNAPIFNSKNYYRINLGINGVSESLVIFLADLGEKNYTIFPNPVQTGTTLYFANENRDPVELYIYDSAGYENVKQSGLRTESINIGDLNLRSGLYYFKVMVGSNVLQGKFIN